MGHRTSACFTGWLSHIHLDPTPMPGIVVEPQPCSVITTVFRLTAEEAALTRVEIQKLTDEQKALRKEFAAAQVPTDSLAGLRIEYSKLIDQVNRLSKAERIS